MGPWYPQVNDSSQIKNFIYLDSLQSDTWHRGVYDKARNKMSIIQSSLNVGRNLQLNELYKLAEREEAKEKRLLEDFVREGKLAPVDAANKLLGFNRLYQNRKILERNLKKIEAVADGKTKQGRIDISSSFRSYLDKAIKEYFAKTELRKINKQDLLNITKDALMFAFKSRDTNSSKEELRSYQELAQVVEQMSAQDEFIQDVFDIYFGSSWNELKASLKEEGKRKAEMNSGKVKNMITKSYGAGGELFEIIESLVLDTLGHQNTKTGKSKQKSDITIAYAEIEIPTFSDKQDDSVRAHFINKYREMYENLNGATGSIVEINAKNYNLTQNFFTENGFSAQSLTSIKNLESMLKAYQYDSNRTDNLIFALTNIGPDTLEEDWGTISHNLAMLIAYFLFDDIDMDIGLGVQAVHLLNLDGVYVPLSCFLFAAYETLQDFESVSDDLVKVAYKPEGVNYVHSTPDDPLTKQKWIDTADKKQNQNALKVSFFKNFPQYIKRNLQNLGM